jgi:uncharacterized membrane protein
MWRLIGIFVLGTITWLITNNIEATTIITLVFHTTNFILYYYHERYWETIDWGLQNKSELSSEEQEKVLERLRKLGYVD